MRGCKCRSLAKPVAIASAESNREIECGTGAGGCFFRISGRTTGKNNHERLPQAAASPSRSKVDSKSKWCRSAAIRKRLASELLFIIANTQPRPRDEG